MIRKALLLGGLTALVFAPAALAQTQEGEGTTRPSGSGTGNVQSGAGQVATPPAARTPAPTRAPVYRPAPVATPRVVVTPRAAPRPVVVVTPRPVAAKKKPARSAPKVRCPSRLERSVLQRRAAGQSVRRIASALDLSRARVRRLQRRGVGLLLADRDPARCDKAGGAKKKASSTTTAASTGATKVVAPSPTAVRSAPASARPPATIALTPKNGERRLAVYIGIGVLVLFLCLAGLQMRGGLLSRNRVYYH